MSTEYYAICAVSGGTQLFFLWYTNEHEDGIVCVDGRVHMFATLESCVAYARGCGWIVDENDAEYDFDAVAMWLQSYRDAEVDPVLLLGAWNLVEDFRRSTSQPGKKFALEGHRVYDKLFHGNGLPAMQYDDDSPEIEWTDEDRREIFDELNGPFSLLVASLKLPSGEVE